MESKEIARVCHAMAEDQDAESWIAFKVEPAVRRMLEKLSTTGLFGATPSEAAESLMLEALREHMGRGDPFGLLS